MSGSYLLVYLCLFCSHKAFHYQKYDIIRHPGEYFENNCIFFNEVSEYRSEMKKINLCILKLRNRIELFLNNKSCFLLDNHNYLFINHEKQFIHNCQDS